MTDTRCGYCLAHHAACASLRLFSGRSCCCECTHGPTITGPPHRSSTAPVDVRPTTGSGMGWAGSTSPPTGKDPR